MLCEYKCIDEHISGFQAWLIRSSWCPGVEVSLKRKYTDSLQTKQLCYHQEGLAATVPACLPNHPYFLKPVDKVLYK